MTYYTQGIPGLPDLTHPTELIQFGSQVVQASLLLVLLILVLGIAIALVSFSLRRHQSEQVIFVGEWSIRYSQILAGLQHLIVVLALLLEPNNPGEYSFPFSLEPGAETNFRVTYQAQGGSRWVYDSAGQLLSNFRLTAIANFASADFASGIVPNEMKTDRGSTVFTWNFDDNVAVRNPFGVFTNTNPIRNTGIIPRLLLLAPALFLWWILLLYWSLSMSIKNVAIAAGIFFACLLTLTYLSRFINAQLAWTMISLILLALTWGLGYNRNASLAAIICTIAGAILPVFALLVPFSGLTLSFAGLLSVIWLAVRHWYGWYTLQL